VVYAGPPAGARSVADSMTGTALPVEAIDQGLDIAPVKAGGRFVKDEEETFGRSAESGKSVVCRQSSIDG